MRFFKLAKKWNSCFLSLQRKIHIFWGFLSLQKMKFMSFEVFKLAKNDIHVFWGFLNFKLAKNEMILGHKNMNVIFCELKKTSKKHEFHFCKLKKTQKTWISFFASLKHITELSCSIQSLKMKPWRIFWSPILFWFEFPLLILPTHRHMTHQGSALR